jgi:FlaA1/EpsC-like NDP-sugar epimerase
MTSTLFPYSYRYIGWPLLIAGLILGFFLVFFDFSISWLDIKVLSIAGGGQILKAETESSFLKLADDNFTNELVALLVLIGSVLVAFSKEKVEDEFFQQLRFESIIWALKIQSLALLLAVLFLYNFAFLTFMMVALVSFYVLYIGRYHYQLMKLKKSNHAE